MDSRVLLAEVRESEDWSPVTNSRSLGVAEKLRGVAGGPVGLDGGVGFGAGEVINKHKKREVFLENYGRGVGGGKGR